jgi:AAA15 family ATPase/GTPase
MMSNKEILQFTKVKRKYYEEEQSKPDDNYDECGCGGCREDAYIDAYDELIEFIINPSVTQKAIRELQEQADRKNREWVSIFNPYNDERGYKLPPVKEMDLPQCELEAMGLPNPFQNKLYYIMKWLNEP